MRTIATQPRFVYSARTEGKCCHKEGCSKNTREGKPYCPDHVEEHDYIAQLLRELEKEEQEKERVKQNGWKEVDVNGKTANEILLILRMNGDRTVRRMARDVNIDIKIVEGYAEALKRAGRIETGTTNRGNTVLKLPNDVSQKLPKEEEEEHE